MLRACAQQQMVLRLIERAGLPADEWGMYVAYPLAAACHPQRYPPIPVRQPRLRRGRCRHLVDRYLADEGQSIDELYREIFGLSLSAYIAEFPRLVESGDLHPLTG
ncbi:MAG: hypothetical protein GY713_09160 [Actinomycetia bacterium]|nr:hypothetical protein [Actinomycetes bacterium]